MVPHRRSKSEAERPAIRSENVVRGSKRPIGGSERPIGETVKRRNGEMEKWRNVD